MASIDSLNFEVILNDTNFRTTIEADKKLAQGFNTELTKFLSVRPRVIVSKTGVDNASQLLGYLTQIQSRMANMPKGAFLVGDANQLNATLQQILPKLDQMIAKTGSAKNGFAGINSTLSGTNALLRTLSQLTGAAFSVVGIRRFLSSLLDITGQFEVQRMALRNMLQDVDGADKIFEDLYRFSSDSTYRFSELAKYAKQLAAFNIDKNGLLETTKMLGDVASGVGVSMDRIILAYGHVKSSGFLRGIQLRSFSQNGVPVLDELAKMFSELEHRAVSLGEVFDKMTKREIPFEMVEQAFKNMTSEGGKFYQMQEILAKTLAGQMNILKGRWENMLAALGQANSGPIKDMVAGVSNLIANYENVGRVLKELIITFGAYKAALFVVTAVSEGLFAASFNLLLMLEKIEAAILANPYALLAAAIAAAGYALYKFNNYMTDAEKITQTASEGIDKYKASLAAENVELDRLFAKLKLAKEGTEEYDRARLAIENRFGPYLQQIRTEQGQIENLADTYQLLADKIKEAQKAKFLESESDAMLKAFNAASNNIYESFKQTAKVNKWSIDQQEDIWRYIVTGELTNKAYTKNLKEMGGGTIGLPGTFLYKDMGRDAESLRKSFMEAAKAYDDGMSALEDVFGKRKKAESGGGTDDADALVYKIASIVEGIKKYDADIAKLRDKAKSVAGITADEKGQLDQLVESRKEQADLYKSIMGIDYDKETRKGESAAEKARKKSISDLKTDIALLEKYLSIYQKIEPIKGEKTAKWMSENIGGKPEDYKDLEKQIETLCASLRELGDEGKAAADAVEARLGLDAASQLVKKHNEEAKAAEKAQKALDKYLDSLQKWMDATQEVTGSGVAYKVSKAIADYKKALAQNNTKFTDNVILGTNAYANSGKDQAREIGKLMNLWAQNRANALATFKNKVEGMADDILKEQLEGFELTNWNDKTLGQIQDIATALENVEVPADIKEMLKDYPDLLKTLESALKQLAGKKLENTVNPEKFKKIAKYASEAADSVKEFAGAMSEIAEITNNRTLADTANGLSDVADMASKATSAYSKLSDLWSRSGGGTESASGIGALFSSAGAAGAMGAWLAIIVALNMKVLQLAAEEEAKYRQMENSRAIHNAIRDKDNIKDSMFGTSPLDEIKQAKEKVDKIREDIDKYRDSIDSFQFTVKHFGFWEKALGWMNAENWSGGGVALGELLPDWMKSISKIEGVFDKYGNLDANVLRGILETYPDLTEEERNWINRAIEDSEAYAAAVKEVSGLLSDIFGDIASDAADALIDSWIEAGNAALDYADILDDVARRYAKMLIQDSILKKVLTEERADEIADKFIQGDVDAVMGMIAGDMEKIAGLAPYWEQILRSFDPYFKREADEEEDDMDGQSLGAGIKSITEETASLLASYINAMRADLSFMRSLQEQGWSDVAILGAFIPTLNDYLQQIAANTFDNAQHTASILSELQAVIGAEGSTGMIVRVQMA